jgi:hypothetical protein
VDGVCSISEAIIAAIPMQLFYGLRENVLLAMALTYKPKYQYLITML